MFVQNSALFAPVGRDMFPRRRRLPGSPMRLEGTDRPDSKLAAARGVDVLASHGERVGRRARHFFDRYSTRVVPGEFEMRVFVGGKWRRGFADYYRGPNEYRIEVLAWRNLERLSRLSFVRPKNQSPDRAR